MGDPACAVPSHHQSQPPTYNHIDTQNDFIQRTEPTSSTATIASKKKREKYSRTDSTVRYAS